MKHFGWLNCLAMMAVVCLLTMVSCERLEMDEENGGTGTKVTFRVTAFEQVPFGQGASREWVVSRAGGTELGEACSRMNLSVFRGDEKVKSVSQKSTDADFGQVSLSLPEGNYTVVVIGHSCDGSATITSPEKVTFPNNKVTDMFYWCDDLEVGSAGLTQDVELERAVSMFRLVVTGTIPSNVACMKFYYTGGSSTFCPLTGYGNVNSRQTVNLDVQDGVRDGDRTSFDVFTCLHADRGTLKMTVTALDAADNTIAERVFEDVGMQRNMITRYTGDFFATGGGGSGSSSGTFSMKVQAEWDDILDESY